MDASFKTGCQNTKKFFVTLFLSQVKQHNLSKIRLIFCLHYFKAGMEREKKNCLKRHLECAQESVAN